MGANTLGGVVTSGRRVYEAGANRIEFDTPFGTTPERGIALLAEHVLEPLRRDLGDRVVPQGEELR